GMGETGTGGSRLYLKSSGQRALRAEEGLELFEWALGAAVHEGRSQVLVLVGERSRMTALLEPNEHGARGPHELHKAAGLHELTHGDGHDLSERDGYDLSERDGYDL